MNPNTPGRGRPSIYRGRADIPAAVLLAAVLALAFLSACATAPVTLAPSLEPGTAGHLAAACSGANPEYCAGASKMLFDAALVSRAICPPSGVTLGEVENAIVAGLLKEPADADAVVVAADALRRAWPCPASRNFAANAARRPR